MTWLDLKENIRALGFDDEMPDELITSANRAINVIFKTIVESHVDYFRMIYDDEEWEPVLPKEITEETAEETVIDMPEKIIDLIPLLAAHYAWLDDDIQKATMYYNEYDDIRNLLVADMERPREYSFYGGLGW